MFYIWGEPVKHPGAWLLINSHHTSPRGLDTRETLGLIYMDKDDIRPTRPGFNEALAYVEGLNLIAGIQTLKHWLK